MELFDFIYIRGTRLLTNIPSQHFLAQEVLAHDVLAHLLDSLTSR
jgi:hypothetical protein